MIRVKFDPASLTGAQQQWWQAWAIKSQSALEELRKDRAEGKEHTFRQPVWAALKSWLLANVFSGKCAYCETKVTAGFVGDAEHYRPKGEVRDADNQVVHVNGSVHPGYYWLCYDWQNLIPACERCNSSHKRTRFPIKSGNSYSDDSNLDTQSLNKLEDPLLLHPYSQGPDPAGCFTFGTKGMIAAKNENAHALATIDVCGLNREDLAADRLLHQNLWTVTFFTKPDIAEAWKEVASSPYSLAVRHAILEKLEAVRKALEVVDADS